MIAAAIAWILAFVAVVLIGLVAILVLSRLWDIAAGYGL